MSVKCTKIFRYGADHGLMGGTEDFLDGRDNAPWGGQGSPILDNPGHTKVIEQWTMNYRNVNILSLWINRFYLIWLNNYCKARLLIQSLSIFLLICLFNPSFNSCFVDLTFLLVGLTFNLLIKILIC